MLWGCFWIPIWGDWSDIMMKCKRCVHADKFILDKPCCVCEYLWRTEKVTPIDCFEDARWYHRVFKKAKDMSVFMVLAITWVLGIFLGFLYQYVNWH